MIRAAQIAAAAVALASIFFSIGVLFNPVGTGASLGWATDTPFGTTNLRTTAASLLMIAVTAGIGAMRKDWVFLLPAALNFLFTALIRVFGLIADGYDPSTLRGLFIALVFFAVAEFALQVFRRAERHTAEAKSEFQET